jgi:glycerophosphoryl diester phosphodiesterase
MTVIVAHRGASGHAPENTIEAFRMAVEMGADAVETDVHLTADGQLALIHDETLDRTTDRGGRVADLTMGDIAAADAGHAFERGGEHPYRRKGLRVPTLPQLLEWLPDSVGLVVEIKARAAVDATIDALRDHPIRDGDRLQLISFDEGALARARELDPDIATGYLLVPGDSIERGLEYAVHNGHAAVHPWEGDLGLNPLPILQQALAYGRRIGCYVVNEPDRMQELAAFGLWGFVTDYPDVAREALSRLPPRQGP